MLSFLALALSVVCSSTLAPTPKPSHVYAGVRTPVLLTLPGGYGCKTDKLIIKIGLNADSLEGGASVSAEPGPAYTITQDTTNKESPKAIYFVPGSNNIEDFDVKFLYYDPIAKSTAQFSMSVFCGTLPNIDGLLPVEVEPKTSNQPFRVIVSEPTYPDQPITLTPAEVKRSLVSPMNLKATWPKACPKSRKPTVRLSLNTTTVGAGGALSAVPVAGYSIFGLEGIKSFFIDKSKTDDEIKQDKYDAIEFQRAGVMASQIDLQFKFLAQFVANETIDVTPIKVEFLCNHVVFQAYTNTTVKVNDASLLSASLFSCLVPLLLLYCA